MTEQTFTDSELAYLKAEFPHSESILFQSARKAFRLEALIARLEATEKENSDLRQLLATERDAFGAKETQWLSEKHDCNSCDNRVGELDHENFDLKKKIELLEAVARAAEEVVKETSEHNPLWERVRTRYILALREALTAMREGKPE